MKIEIDDKTVREWIHGETIINSYWSDKHQNLLVCLKNDDFRYSLLKFFRVGNAIRCSEEITNTNEEFFIVYMMRDWMKDREKID